MGLRSGNPTLNDKTFRAYSLPDRRENLMTVWGTVNKTAMLLALVFGASGWTWYLFVQSQDVGSIAPWMIVGLLGGLIFALITIFKMEWAPYTAPVYAILEGLFLGGISAVVETQYPGIVMQAVGLTFGTLAALLIAYSSRLIKVTHNLRLGIVAATGGITLVYIVSIIMRLFGVDIPYIHGNGIVGIGFSLFVVVIAALNLVLDFDFIENGARKRASAYMEWYGAFGLIVTLVWLYLEILRLLTKIRGR
ncbi:Bax inhibitor-1/YccA family protein [Thermodesulfobacteriota bacterium]